MLRARKSWTGIFENPALGRKSGPGLPRQLEAEMPRARVDSSIQLCNRIERHWYDSASASDRYRPKCATEDEIHAFEQRHGVKLPTELLDYFLFLNGMDQAPGFFRFWPLTKLIPLRSESVTVLEAERYFVFADYMMGTWYYAIYLGDDPFLQNRVILKDFPGRPVIALNFSEFIELYLIDSPKLYGNA
jgi:hypothetical protein